MLADASPIATWLNFLAAHFPVIRTVSGRSLYWGIAANSLRMHRPPARRMCALRQRSFRPTTVRSQQKRSQDDGIWRPVKVCVRDRPEFADDRSCRAARDMQDPSSPPRTSWAATTKQSRRGGSHVVVVVTVALEVRRPASTDFVRHFGRQRVAIRAVIARLDRVPHEQRLNRLETAEV